MGFILRWLDSFRGNSSLSWILAIVVTVVGLGSNLLYFSFVYEVSRWEIVFILFWLIVGSILAFPVFARLISKEIISRGKND